jgi:vancomycin aglycone glucosyltransferase
VYFGFGSMPVPQPVVGTLTETARALGRRMILAQGWAELAASDPGPACLVVDDVNQDALFPRVAAVVHHGGAGTTTGAARAGVPQVVVPLFSDQFYWGFRLQQLGVGATVPMSTIAVETLARHLREALQPETAARARAMAPRIATAGALKAAQRLTELVI